MSYTLLYSNTAIADLSLLPRMVAQRVVDKLEYYSSLENPLSVAKALSGKFKGSYRFRIGDYRVLFGIDSKGEISILHIITIKHRKESYR